MSNNYNDAVAKITEYNKRKQNELLGGEPTNPLNKNQSSSQEKIDLVFEKEEFNPTHKSELTTASKLAKKIANKFASYFSDVAGFIIKENNTGMLECYLYFKDTPPTNDGRVKAMVKLSDQVKSNLDNTVSSTVSNLMSTTAENKTNKKYTLSEHAQKALKKFMFPNRDGSVNFPQRISEQFKYQRTFYPYDPKQGEILLRLEGLNLNAIVKEMYGYKYNTVDEASGKQVTNYCEYDCRILNRLASPFINMTRGANIPCDYAIIIDMIDGTELRKAVESFGIPNSVGEISMITPDIR